MRINISIIKILILTIGIIRVVVIFMMIIARIEKYKCKRSHSDTFERVHCKGNSRKWETHKVNSKSLFYFYILVGKEKEEKKGSSLNPLITPQIFILVLRHGYISSTFNLTLFGLKKKKERQVSFNILKKSIKTLPTSASPFKTFISRESEGMADALHFMRISTLFY